MANFFVLCFVFIDLCQGENPTFYQALFLFRLVSPFLRKHETKNVASDPVRVNKSDVKIPADRELTQTGRGFRSQAS